MTIQWGDTGKIAYGPLKTYTFSLATPNETLLGTPVASLPTANPGTPQITITIGNSDLPTISPSPISVKYCAILYVGGKNTDAAAQTINYQCYKNGGAVSGATGSQSVASNNFWTMSHYRFYDVSVGDVLGVSLWSASANMNYDYYALVVYPTRPNIGKAAINTNVAYGALINPSLTKGTPNVVFSNNPLIYPVNTANNFSLNGAMTFGTLSWSLNSPTVAYYAFQTYHSDNTTSSTTSDTSATYRPNYRRSTIPSTISFREILR